MRVFFFWEAGRGIALGGQSNPYAGLLARALEPRGIYLDEGDYSFERDWLEKGREDHEVLHLHWLQHFYRTEDLGATVDKCSHFADNLAYARTLGYRIVWTMHNFYPHERPFPKADHLARLFVASHTDAVITHCRYAADLCKKRFFYDGEMSVIPHGNFIDVFPNEISGAEARQQLGITPDSFVYLFFGNAREYKSIDKLIEAFLDIDPVDGVLLLMMRTVFNPEYARRLEEIGGSDPRILVHMSDFFPEADFQLYANSADVVVLPFSEVLTSGSTIAALGFGKPVILPAKGCLPELIDDSMGILYDPDRRDALPEAMKEIRERDVAAAGLAARACAERFEWEGIADEHAAIYSS